MMRMRSYPAVAGAVVLEATMAEWCVVRRRLFVMQEALAREVVPAGAERGVVATPPVTLPEALQIIGLIDNLREQADLLDALRQEQGTATAWTDGSAGGADDASLAAAAEPPPEAGEPA
jgi:hypothetical protein